MTLISAVAAFFAVRGLIYSAGPVSMVLRVWAVMIALRVLAWGIRRYTWLFKPDGIELVVTYAAIPFKKIEYGRDEIHIFGWGHQSHSRTTGLRFAASGEYFALAPGATEQEADEFLRLLQGHGIEYSRAYEPVRRRSAANTLLG